MVNNELIQKIIISNVFKFKYVMVSLLNLKMNVQPVDFEYYSLFIFLDRREFSPSKI